MGPLLKMADAGYLRIVAVVSIVVIQRANPRVDREA